MTVPIDGKVCECFHKGIRDWDLVVDQVTIKALIILLPGKRKNMVLVYMKIILEFEGLQLRDFN